MPLNARGDDGAKRPSIRFVYRDSIVDIADFLPRETLLDWLRLRARATGTKEGCAEGDCGACTVAIARPRDGVIVHEPVNSCILLLGQADGAEIIAIEDIADRDHPHPVQTAMVEHHGSQCGFCTPGIVMSLFALYHEGARPPTRAAINDQLAGNLCRCTGYRSIIDAALDASGHAPDDRFTARASERLLALQAIDDGRDIFVGDDTGFFAAPASESALAALYAQHPDAVIVAGATDVGLWITKALREPRKIIWIGRVRGLDAIERSDTELSLSATATLARAAPHLAAIHDDLGEIMRRFGSPQVRASGTVGGNIANGSPIGDLAPCLIALDASIELRQGSATRTLALEDFFLTYGKQDRRPGEYLRRIVIPVPPVGAEFRAYKVSKRIDEDISAVLGAFHARLDGRRLRDARIAYGGMAGVPKRASGAEATCVGLDLDDETSWSPALDALSDDFTPLDDARASAGYRALVARNLLRKALIEMRGGSPIATRLSLGRGADAAE